VVREVARLERGSLRSETLGLSLAEARAIWVGWRKRWPNGKPRSSSRKGNAVPIVAGSARAKGTTESCFVPRLANYNWKARSCTAARADAKARRAPAH
jgi:hypothetical protein